MTRILIAATIRLMSDLIQVACKNQPDLTVIGSVQDKAQVLAYKNHYDVLLLSHDVAEALFLVQMFGTNPSAPAVIVLGLPNVEPLILRYLEAGAAGCIREQDSSAQLVQAIRLAAARQVALTADLFPLVIKRVSALANMERTSSRATPAMDEKNLTPREREILHLIAQGYGNREIAHHLTIEMGTAKNHVHNILEKLQVKNRRDAAMYYSLGLV